MKRFICILVSALTIAAAAMSAAASSSTLYGDANSDGKINAKDVLVIRKHIAKYNVSIDLEAADVDGDGRVNARDVLNVRKFIAKLPVTLGPATKPTTQPTQPTTAEPTTEPLPTLEQNSYDMKQLEPATRLLGRAIASDTVVKMDQTASGFEFAATCESKLVLNLKWTGEDGLLGVMIDNDFENMRNVEVYAGTRNVTVAKDIAKGEHIIRIVKLNEFSRNAVIVNTVTMFGTIAAAPPASKDLKIEFFGDSITCGYGNLCSGRSMEYPFCYFEDGYKTYASYAAQKLNADFSVCAASGYGILRSYTGSETQVMDTIWKYALLKSEKVEFDMAAYNADVYVINLGTNDCSYANNNQITADLAELKAGCKKIIDNLRSVNSDAIIIWIGGMNGALKNNYCDVAAAVTQLSGEMDDVYFRGNFYTGQNGGDWHPSAANHKDVSTAVADYIQQCIDASK